MDTKLEILQEKIIKLEGNLRSIAASYAADNQDADDIYSEVVEAILNKSEPTDSNSRILTLAKWRCQDHKDRLATIERHTQPEVQMDEQSESDETDELDMQEMAYQSRETPEDAVVDAETRATIAKAVSELAPEYQQLIRLLSAGESKSDIADKMGVARPVISLKLKKLRETFSKLGFQNSFA